MHLAKGITLVSQLELQIVLNLPWQNLTTILTKLLLKMNQSKAMLCWRHLESTQEFAPHLWTEFTESIDVVGARKNRIESAQNISDVLEVSAVKDDDDECCATVYSRVLNPIWDGEGVQHLPTVNQP